MQTYLTVGEGDERQGFREFISLCSPEIVKVFDFPIVEGDANCLKDPEKLIIPRSMARRLFGNCSAIGQQIHLEEKLWRKGEVKNLTVGAVYEDFPENTQLDNMIYTTMDKQQEVRVDLTPLTDIYYTPNQLDDIVKLGNPDTIRILILIALLVILVAGINFSNFSTSLAPLRIKSINTQKVLGSSSAGLRWGVVIEGVGISVLACLLSFALIGMLNHTQMLSFVTADTVLSHHLPIWGWMVGIALGVGLLAGAYPARYMTSFSPAC